MKQAEMELLPIGTIVYYVYDGCIMERKVSRDETGRTCFQFFSEMRKQWRAVAYPNPKSTFRTRHEAIAEAKRQIADLRRILDKREETIRKQIAE